MARIAVIIDDAFDSSAYQETATGKNSKNLSLFIKASLAKLVLLNVRPWL
jgi:hypothetical protein